MKKNKTTKITSASESEKKNQVQLLINLVPQSQLFHDKSRHPYASLEVGNHWECWPLQSKTFRDWLTCQFISRYGLLPRKHSLDNAIDNLSSLANFEKSQSEVYLRKAGSDQEIFLDIGDEGWSVIRITSQGWDVIKRVPLKFRRTKSMSSFPIPEKVEGTQGLDLLRRFLNVSNEDDFKLIISWIIGTLRPCGPYPILFLGGEQGSAKSTTTKILRALTDPSSSPLRAPIRTEEELMIYANNNAVLSFDNMSSLTPWMSDAFCRLATGGSLSKRQLYSDSEETILSAQRPVILNGIDEFVTREDLSSRTIFIDCPIILAQQRMSEASLWRDFQELYPRIFGALLNAMSGALKKYPNMKSENNPRMADFANFIDSAEESLDWPRQTFARIYEENQKQVNDKILEQSELFPLIESLAKPVWEGTATELLEQFIKYQNDYKLFGYPRRMTPRTISDDVRRLAPHLRRAGIETNFYKTGGLKSKRMISFKRSNDIVPFDASVANCESIEDSVEAIQPFYNHEEET